MRKSILICDVCGKEEIQGDNECSTMVDFRMVVQQGTCEMGVGPIIEHCCNKCADAFINTVGEMIAVATNTKIARVK